MGFGADVGAALSSGSAQAMCPSCPTAGECVSKAAHPWHSGAPPVLLPVLPWGVQDLQIPGSLQQLLSLVPLGDKGLFLPNRATGILHVYLLK